VGYVNGGDGDLSDGPLLELSKISKRFGAVQALGGADLALHAGEVVALVGDNGAGKSTLANVIAGVSPPDSGEIRWEGQLVTIRRPHDAKALGIVTVYQDLALCSNLDVVANLFLGAEQVTAGVLDTVAMEQRARELLSTLWVQLPSVRTPVAALSGGQRQAVAIARALLGDPKVVILDEPTAALGVAQTAHVLDLIERMRDQRLAVAMITHNLADVRAVADRVVVLHLGHTVGDFPVASTSQQQIVAAILGAPTSSAPTTATVPPPLRPSPGLDLPASARAPR
jgi:D-xylose transport system ATP-binding protein